MTPIFSGKIIRGKILYQAPEVYNRHLKSFIDGSEVDITVRKHRKKRTSPQNRYYWGVVVPILGGNFGYTKDEMHEALKWKFLQKQDAPIPTVGSTRKLSTSQFVTYIESIVRWASMEYQVWIPDPDSVDYDSQHQPNTDRIRMPKGAS